MCGSAEADLKPHLNRYWLTPKPDPGFDEKCADICAVCQTAPAVAEQGGQTVSADEMTGIQALERAAKSLPMKPGHVERREFEYIRNGTKALIAAFDVATRTVRGTIGDTRTEEDFVGFMKDLFASASPTAPWRVVCDNLNTHMSEGIIVERSGRDEKTALQPNQKTAIAGDGRRTTHPLQKADIFMRHEQCNFALGPPAH